MSNFQTSTPIISHNMHRDHFIRTFINLITQIRRNIKSLVIKNVIGIYIFFSKYFI